MTFSPMVNTVNGASRWYSRHGSLFTCQRQAVPAQEAKP